MGFDVIPAIDVAAGRLVAWTSHGARSLEAFDADPLAAAHALADAGSTWVHVADVDHAIEGRDADPSTVSRIHEALPGVRIQASGGLRHPEAEMFLGAGATRVVLGSAALVDVQATEALLARIGGALLVGLEVEDGRILSRGREPVELDLMETLGWLAAAGAPGFLVTAVSRVGGLAGPDVSIIRRVARAGPPVIAAGGISSLEDLRAVREAGARGAVVGRAVLEGSLDLTSALAWAAGP